MLVSVQVITRRIIHLVTVLQVPPHDIIAITFTRKGAAEMKARLARELPAADAEAVRVGTFHSVAMSILRRCEAFCCTGP